MGPTRRWTVYPICTLKIPEEGGNVKALPGGEGSWRVWSGPIPPEESGAGGMGRSAHLGRAGRRKKNRTAYGITDKSQAGAKVCTGSSPAAGAGRPGPGPPSHFPRDDHHPGQVVEVADDHVGEHLGIGQPAGEDHCVDQFGEAAQQGANPLAIWRAWALYTRAARLVSRLDAPLDLPAVVGAQQGGHAPLAPQLFSISRLGVFAGVAQVHHIEGVGASLSGRGEKGPASSDTESMIRPWLWALILMPPPRWATTRFMSL